MGKYFVLFANFFGLRYYRNLYAIKKIDQISLFLILNLTFFLFCNLFVNSLNEAAITQNKLRCRKHSKTVLECEIKPV